MKSQMSLNAAIRTDRFRDPVAVPAQAIGLEALPQGPIWTTQTPAF